MSGRWNWRMIAMKTKPIDLTHWDVFALTAAFLSISMLLLFIIVS